MLGSILAVFFAALVVGIPIAVSLILTVVVACLMNPTLPIDGMYIFKNLVMSLNVYAILAVPLICHGRRHYVPGRYFETLV